MSLTNNPFGAPNVLNRFTNTSYDIVKSVYDNLDHLLSITTIAAAHQISATPPVTRLDGTTLQTGDTYFDGEQFVYTYTDENTWILPSDTGDASTIQGLQPSIFLIEDDTVDQNIEFRLDTGVFSMWQKTDAELFTHQFFGYDTITGQILLDDYDSGSDPKIAMTTALLELTGSQTISQDLDVTGDITGASVQFTGGTGTQGTVTWNTDEETLDIEQNGAILQVGQELHIHARNNSGAQIDNGTPVMATGTIGASGRITISPMDSTDPTNAKFFIGVTTEDIPDGSDGKVTHFGKVRGIDTSSWLEGDVLWLDTSVAGQFTNVEPTTGMALPIAFVITTHATVGTLMVRTENLDENLYEPALGNPTEDGMCIASTTLGVRSWIVPGLFVEDAAFNIIGGTGAGAAVTTGGNNLLSGSEAGNSITQGNYNLASGEFALQAVTTESFNVAIGPSAGFSLQGEKNALMGYQAGYQLGISANRNTGLGYQAGGSASATTSDSLFLGHGAGPNANGDYSNELYINNVSTTTPLIHGYFNAHASGPKVSINGDFGLSGLFEVPIFKIAGTGTGDITQCRIELGDSNGLAKHKIISTGDGFGSNDLTIGFETAVAGDISIVANGITGNIGLIATEDINMTAANLNFNGAAVALVDDAIALSIALG